MRKFCSLTSGVKRFVKVTLAIALIAGPLAAQSRPVPQAARSTPAQTVASDRELGEIQGQLLKLLRLSPKMTTVIARDPSLLSNQQYVTQNNPELAAFLLSHPEIARNPDFYLFTNLGPHEGRTEEALERKVWPELPRPEGSSQMWISPGDVVPFLVFVCILGALIWLIRVLLENRRWSRIFKLQSDVHGKLIEKFGTNQELLTYMDTDAGKRFLEAAPIPIDFKNGQAFPSPVARVLTSLQIGIVLSLLGAGFLFIRYHLTQGTVQLLAFGTLILLLGIGFIISAGVTWVLGKHLGLMAQVADGSSHEDKERQ